MPTKLVDGEAEADPVAGVDGHGQAVPVKESSETVTQAAAAASSAGRAGALNALKSGSGPHAQSSRLAVSTLVHPPPVHIPKNVPATVKAPSKEQQVAAKTTSATKMAVAVPANPTPPVPSSSSVGKSAAPKQSSSATNKAAAPKPAAPKSTAKSSTSKVLPASSTAVDGNKEPELDPVVEDATRSIISLLQLYGPLSYEQLKFNMLPQLVLIDAPVGAVDGRPRDKLQKVLDTLLELGVIHLIDKAKMKAASRPTVSKPKAAAKKADEDKMEQEVKSLQKEDPKPAAAAPVLVPKVKGESNALDPNPIYCYGNGIPLMQTILPSDLLREIRLAGEEVINTKQRIEILTRALTVEDEPADVSNKPDLVSSEGSSVKSEQVGSEDIAEEKSVSATEANERRSSKMTPQHAQKVLKQLFALHPEIVRDPVYASIMRMFKVDAGVLGKMHKFAQTDRFEGLMLLNESGGQPRGNIRRGLSLVSSAQLVRQQSGLRRGLSFGSGKKRSSSGASLVRANSGEGSKKKKRKVGRPPKT